MKLRKLYDNHTFQRGKDVYGRPFKSYSKKYGERKRANSFKNQSAEFANTTSPVLTGDLRGDSTEFATPTDFGLRFASHGLKFENLKKMDRVLSEEKQPLPKTIVKIIVRDVNKEISKRITKEFPNKTTKIVLGK
tara:strand:+ start:635 stop:1039 length:405 start_codon:yes stop_codon:yes gene_type:complete